MNTLNKIAISYLKWLSPIALIAAILSGAGKSGNTLFYDILGVTTILWILFLIYIVFALAFQHQLRNRFVRWLARINENDERESAIVGKASKNTFIFMTGIILLFAFLSIIQIEVYKNKNLNSEGKSNGEIRLGMAARLIPQKSEPAEAIHVKDNERNYIINYKQFPLTVDGTLIMLALIQIGAFYYFSKKEEKV